MRKRLYRYKFYRKYLTDLWGLLTTRNKKTKTLKFLVKKLVPIMKKRIRRMAKKSMRKKMYIKLALKKKFFDPNKIFDLSKISKQSRKVRTKRPTYRGLLLAMKKKMRVYYGMKINRKKLRKLSFLVKVRSNRFFSRILESRLDSLIFRSNFSSSILEARQLIKHGKVKILVPKLHNNLTWVNLDNPGHRVHYFTPIELQDRLKIRRKHYLIKTLKAYKFCCYPPDYLYVNFRLMHSFTTTKLRDPAVKFIFPGNLSYFFGLSKYF